MTIMATMTIRTTVAFDLPTAARLERLAKRWGTSKSEALRRALATVEKAESAEVGQAPDFPLMQPLEILDWLHANPQIPPGWGERFRGELRKQRDRDAEIEGERELAKAEKEKKD
jgi:hypothetical protein